MACVDNVLRVDHGLQWLNDVGALALTLLQAFFMCGGNLKRNLKAYILGKTPLKQSQIGS